MVGISRRAPAGAGVEHLAADLSDPAQWAAVGASFEKELGGFDGEHVAFIHAAATLEPVGFAGEVENDAYLGNVLVNSAAPQFLGHLFLAAVRQVRAKRYLAMLTSGAATSVYPGMTGYGAGKAAIDQWVRNAGAEQSRRGGVQILSIGPGTVDTGMQAQARDVSEEDFPRRQKFVDLQTSGKLSDPDEVARDIWNLFEQDLENGSVVDLRQLSKSGDGGAAPARPA